MLLVGCGESQQSAPPVKQQSKPLSEVDRALLGSAENGNIEAVKQHLAAGADLNAKVVSGPLQGKTPLDAANETNHPETADLLRKHGGKTGEELETAIEFGLVHEDS